ncbi:MAG: RNA polymerase sigma factor, partial [Planctomycetota bacterium]
MENTDKSLVDAHCRGDREAFAELVRRYGGSVLGYLRKVSSRPDLAEDLFQETFRRAHEKAHTLRSSQFKPWL